ncbi:MAG: hypothetical protein HZB46_11225 [Solirubrobacterales bacterium]|nr:hypothetical protein [Solirubrobacterales bacterium]
MEHEREPDITEDPREKGTGEAGYPEENPAGEGGTDRSGGDRGSGAPSPSTGEEADREQSTGNPGAAG